MAFSTSFPSISSTSEPNIEMSSADPCQSGKKWSSVPVLTSAQIEVSEGEVDLDQDINQPEPISPKVVSRTSSSFDVSPPKTEPGESIPRNDSQSEQDSTERLRKHLVELEVVVNSGESPVISSDRPVVNSESPVVSSESQSQSKHHLESPISYPVSKQFPEIQTKEALFDRVRDPAQSPTNDSQPSKCDLISQLENRPKDTARDGKPDQIEPEMMSSFDNNGNPLDLEEEVKMESQPEEKVEKAAMSQSKLSNELALVIRSTDSEASIKASSDETSDDKTENPIKLGFRSNLQKSVEGFMEEPKYFINAAALSEDLDTYTMPSLESVGGFEENEESDKNDSNNRAMCLVTALNAVATDSVKLTNATNDISRDLPTILVKPRVPMSKSFPDIIQTTFVDDRCEFASKKLLKTDNFIQKEPSFNDLAADSLEELSVKPGAEFDRKKHDNNVQFDFKIDSKLKDIMDMSQSQSQIGILAEKPPEAWVIDFNSLSLDSEAFEDSDMSGSIKSSNPTSLAYFIDIDEKAAEAEKNQPAKSPEKKKIFSMFVDFGTAELEKQSQQQSNCSQPTIKPSRLPVHRNVMNVLKDGEISHPILSQQNNNLCSKGSSTNQVKKRTFQYPSPILQHKVAGEASRSPIGNPEGVETPDKAKEPREESPAAVMANNMEMSTTSNRSSLHVATDFDMAFSTSFISSMETSGLTADEVCSKGPCFKLGKDLLRMFQDGINTDVNICVNGRYLRAHKCILSSRSQYFAALFSGQLLEKAGNTITLDGFSYNVVQFAMCHIYSGTNEIPDSIDLLELATLTDLLGLEGLRENISQTIRVKFCHNFHRPCTGCISGVLECLPIALSYEMDELHRKMTKWICKHFVRIWPTKAFASLGDDLIEKCLRYSVNHLSVDNILDITLGCDQLLTTMPSVRWTEPIFSVVNQLSKSCIQFIGENFSQVLQSQRFLLFGKGQQWNISRIEGTFVEAMILMKPDEACLSHTALSRLIELGTETIDEVEWSTMFVDFLRMLAKEIERYLIANASKAVLSKYWEHLGQDVRKRICTSSFLGYDKAGNKIVKGSASTTGAKQANPGRLTPSERSSSISSIKSNSSTKLTARQLEHTKSLAHGFSQASYSTSGVSTAKIASVRPIQNVFSTATEAQPPTSLPKSSQNKTSNFRHPTQLSRRKTDEKEKSFSNSPRNSVASSSIASANRTPLNTLTPITPSKPGLGIVGSSNIATKGTRASSGKNAHTFTTVPTITTPPKSTFITNSARANSVSKPNLRQKNVSSTSTRSTTPRTPNLSQPSRYASTLGVSGTNRKSRGSISGSEKSEKPLQTVSSGDYKPRQARVTGVSAFVPTASSRERREKSMNKNTGGSTQTSSNSSSRKTSAKSSTRSTSANIDPMRDSIMSKSTIENDSGEPKIRTLAEIGRSSTFSKDEPTILGKLDQNHALSIDFS
ncbi:unnamed protein product [Allacma fusca]|uniref:BTB domain-containing protein n=1 Tax=Allacma fusca TaxID=39272 RepID=A0A8J2PVE1_9HEXA|nr:unnamed protein product [Allacma fusca]